MYFLGPLLLVFSALGFAAEAIAANLVTWDKYSLSINGTRVFINAAEFHYQRLPVPELWDDVFEKLKANGFNTLSIYFFWSYHSGAKGVYDFESPGKNLQGIFDAAKAAGLWVIARAGPYCNAETNGGGLALWGSDGSFGNLRTGDEAFHQAWLPWIAAVGAIIARNEIGKGGPVILNQIENELQETRHVATDTLVVYMQQIQKVFRDAGVTVPFTSNEKGMRSQSWSTDYQDVGGSVEIYGLDSYPGSMSCTNPDAGFNVPRSYYQWFSNYSFTQPSFLAEFEGGWFSGWGAPFYDQCTAEHDPAFADVYYKNNIGQRVTLQSIYMAFGGTNWGHSAAPVVYTSYDYSAPLRETRQQGEKLFQTKLVNMFSASSPHLLKTRMVGNGTATRTNSSAIFSWILEYVDARATSFMVVQQNKSPSRANVTFSAELYTSIGTVTVPNVALYGRQSKILVTDYIFGSHALLYSSADIAAAGIFGDTDVLVLYLKEGQSGQFAFRGGRQQNLTFSASGASTVSSFMEGTQQHFKYIQARGVSAVRLSNDALVYLLDQSTAWRFWAPKTTRNPLSELNQQIFVIGPYLVRRASVHGSVLRVSGDSDETTTLEAFVGDDGVQTIEWNGMTLPTTKTSYGALRATIPAPNKAISLPSLKAAKWFSADSLPEKMPEFDDSRWVTCNKTTTRSPVAPLSLPVLFSSDYGYYAGDKLYRGRFAAGSAATAVNLTASGGLGFGWTAWLNGQLLGGDAGSATKPTTSAVLAFPASALRPAGTAADNVLAVLVGYHGHDQTSTAKGVANPRGLLGAALVAGAGARFSSWKIQGNAGGARGAAALDPVRGPLNEGGLYAERLGWFLPGFDAVGAAGFVAGSSPVEGVSGAGVRFYTTTFALDLAADLDVPLGIELGAPAGTVARVMLFVNGYQFGKFVPHLGPQTRFPVPPGVINNRGVNTLGLTLWAQTDAGAKLQGVKLFSYGVYQTAFNFSQDWSRLQPRWTDRSMYA